METAEIRREEIFPSPLRVEKLIFGGTPHLTLLISAPNTHTETSDVFLPLSPLEHAAQFYK